MAICFPFVIGSLRILGFAFMHISLFVFSFPGILALLATRARHYLRMNQIVDGSIRGMIQRSSPILSTPRFDLSELLSWSIQPSIHHFTELGPLRLWLCATVGFRLEVTRRLLQLIERDHGILYLD
jgi:hypothetical protein